MSDAFTKEQRTEHGKIIWEALHELVNCWVNETVPSDATHKKAVQAQVSLAYLVTGS